jgi:hypothetical protein
MHTACVKIYPSLAIMGDGICIDGDGVRKQLRMWTDMVQTGIDEDFSYSDFLKPRLTVLAGWVVLALRMRLESEHA